MTITSPRQDEVEQDVRDLLAKLNAMAGTDVAIRFDYLNDAQAIYESSSNTIVFSGESVVRHAVFAATIHEFGHALCRAKNLPSSHSFAFGLLIAALQSKFALPVAVTFYDISSEQKRYPRVRIKTFGWMVQRLSKLPLEQIPDTAFKYASILRITKPYDPCYQHAILLDSAILKSKIKLQAELLDKYESEIFILNGVISHFSRQMKRGVYVSGILICLAFIGGCLL